MQKKANFTCQALSKFEVNNKIMFYYTRGYKRSFKLVSLWYSLMLIIKKTGPDCYTLKNIETGQLVNRVHTKFMHFFYNNNEFLLRPRFSTIFKKSIFL